MEIEYKIVLFDDYITTLFHIAKKKKKKKLSKENSKEKNLFMKID